MKPLVAILAVTLLFPTLNCVCGQNVVEDYWLDWPVRYRPSDPWCRGVVFRVQTGNGGIFYNCEGEQDKRYSPYIDWKCQPAIGYPSFPVARDVCDQTAQLKWWIRAGAGNCLLPGHKMPCYPHGCPECTSIVPAAVPQYPQFPRRPGQHDQDQDQPDDDQIEPPGTTARRAG